MDQRRGLPRPQTQIPVFDEFGNAVAYLDMGWEDVKVAVEYDGDQHRTDQRQYAEVIRRVRAALARRSCCQPQFQRRERG